MNRYLPAGIALCSIVYGSYKAHLEMCETKERTCGWPESHRMEENFASCYLGFITGLIEFYTIPIWILPYLHYKLIN